MWPPSIPADWIGQREDWECCWVVEVWNAYTGTRTLKKAGWAIMHLTHPRYQKIEDALRTLKEHKNRYPYEVFRARYVPTGEIIMGDIL